MTANLPSVAARAASPRRFDAVTIGLHWTTVALVVALFASAWSIGLASDAGQAAVILTLHRSIGAATWVLVVVRLAWRLTLAWLPPFPPAMPKAQQWAARLSEYGLYAFLLFQPVTGLAQSLTRGRPFMIFWWTAPKVMAPDKSLTHLFSEIHEVTALVLLGLIALHVAAALFHHLVLKDEVLASMLPWKPSGINPRSARSGS